MRVTIDLGIKNDLTGNEIMVFDAKLRKLIPALVGWSYSPLTGELVLDFGDTEDNKLLQQINDWLNKAGGKKILRIELMEIIKQWQE